MQISISKEYNHLNEELSILGHNLDSRNLDPHNLDLPQPRQNIT